MRTNAIEQAAETQDATAPLPLFRPEVLSKQERFFGEVLRIRPFSFGLLGWLVAGVAALIFSVLYFGKYTETERVRGVVLRGPNLEGSQFDSLEEKLSMTVPHLDVVVKPGMDFAIRCLQCASPVAQIPAIVRGVSNDAAPAGEANSVATRQVIEFSVQASEKWPASGAAVEIAFPIGQRRLFELFEPSSMRGKSQP